MDDAVIGKREAAAKGRVWVIQKKVDQEGLLEF
jgi:hypothetical protein